MLAAGAGCLKRTFHITGCFTRRPNDAGNVYRRRLLAAVAAVAGLSGCNTGNPDGGPTATETDAPTTTPTLNSADASTADGLDGYSFDIVDETDLNDPRVEQIDVTFDPASNAVVVSSVIVVGSSSCSRAGLESILYGRGTLQVALASEAKGRAAVPRESPVACTGDIYAELYRLRATFDGGLTERVVVREGGRTEEVER